MTKRKNLLSAKISILLFFIVLLSIVIYKAINIPITHDEVSASVYYATLPIWDILMSDIWPSNHILSTLFIKLSETFFGIEPWSVRLPSMISFCTLFTFLFGIANRYFSESKWLFMIPFFIILCNPFLLDFYSLARGYGMSNALMAGAVFFLLLFCASFQLKWYYLAIAFSIFAAYANFTLLIFWVALQIVLFAIYIVHYRLEKKSFSTVFLPFIYTIIADTLFAMLCYSPLYKMQSTNQFIYWSKDGFYKDTVYDQFDNLLYGTHISPDFLAIPSIILFLFVYAYSLYNIFKNIKSAISNPIIIITLLLFTVWFVNMVQVLLLGTPYLTGRTAISYYILFGFVFMFLLREIYLKFGGFTKLLLPFTSILLLLHLGFTINLKNVKEWWYDAYTYSVIDYLYKYQMENPKLKVIDLNTNWIFNPSFYFYKKTGKIPFINLSEYHKDVDANSNTLFYYATYEDKVLLTNYIQLPDFEGKTGFLLIRKNNNK